MSWQELVTAPLFWIASTAGAIALSILANLLTPPVSALITRSLKWRQLGVRKNQIRRRKKIIALQPSIERQISMKLDGVILVLLSIAMLVTGGFLLQTDGVSPQTGLQTLVRLVSMMAVVIAIIALQVGMSRALVARTAERRENARREFIANDRTATVEQIKAFEDKWDLKEFGVTSQDTE